MKFLPILSATFAFFFVSVAAGFNPKTDSLLLYLDKITDALLAGGERQNATGTEMPDIEQECSNRSYNFSVYYRMVYFRVCEMIDTSGEEKKFDEFCEKLDSNQSGESTDSRDVDRTASLQRIFGPGIESEQRWLALKSCGYINGYYAAKARKNSSLLNPVYPNYTEWFIHTLPFALPVACGFTEAEYQNRTFPLATADCLPTSYKWGLYVTFFLDGLLILAVVVANVVVLVVVVHKTRIIHSTHGQLRASLAVADMLTALIVCGSINTSHTTYFGPHKFVRSGESVTILDYHTQSYIDGFGLVTVAALAASVFTLVAISVDRFIAVFRPVMYKIHYQRIMTSSTIGIVVIWILSTLISIFPVLLPSLTYEVTALGVIIAPKFYLVYIVCLGGSLLCIWCLNIWMFLVLKRHHLITSKMFWRSQMKARSSIDRQVSTSQSPPVSPRRKLAGKCNSLGNPDKKSFELTLASTVLLIVFAFTVAIIPAIFVIVAGLFNSLEPNSESFDPVAKAAWNSFAYLSSRILFSNSFFNCLIYSYKSDEFRNATKSVLACDCVNQQQPLSREFFQLSVKKTNSIKSVEEVI